MAADPAERAPRRCRHRPDARGVRARDAGAFLRDSGFPDFNRVENGVQVGPTCVPGAIAPTAATSPSRKISQVAAGVTDLRVVCRRLLVLQQWSTARLLFKPATTGAALFGGILFGIAGPRRAASNPRVAAAPA